MSSDNMKENASMCLVQREYLSSIPFSTKFTDSFAEENSPLQLENFTSKTMSSSSALNNSNGKKHPAKFERWCVDPYTKFYVHRRAYYYLFLLIMDYIVTFIQVSKAMFPWSMFRRFMTYVGDLSSIGIQPAATIPQYRQILKQPVRTVSMSPCVDSLPFRSEHLPAFSRNTQTTPQILDQQQTSTVQRLEIMSFRGSNSETRTIRTGLKDPVPIVHVRRSTSVVEDIVSVGIRPTGLFKRLSKSIQSSLPLMSEHLPAFVRNSKTTPRTLEQKRFSAVQRQEIMCLQASNAVIRTMGTGLKDSVPMVLFRRTTTIFENIWSGGIRLVAPIARRRHNLHKPDGRKGVSQQATPKHKPTAGVKASSSNKHRNTDPRREERCFRPSNTETRTKDGKKGTFKRDTTRHGPKTGDTAFSNKQRRNTDPRREERRPGTSNTETRTHDRRKGVFEQSTSKRGPNPGQRASSSNHRRSTDPRLEEKRSGTSHADRRTHGDKTGIFQQVTSKQGPTNGKQASSSKKRQNSNRGNRT